MWRIGDQWRTVELKTTAIRNVQSGHAVEEGCLACTVRPDQTINLAAPNGQRDIAQGLDASEVFGDLLRLKQDVRHHAFSCNSRARSGAGHKPDER